MTRDPRNARFLTWASLRWIVRNRAWTPWYLIRYWRFLWLKVRHPHIVTEGFVVIGRRVELYARKGYGQLILGRWVHIGEENRLRVHEGTLRVGDKTVFGRDNTINTYLDIEIGGSCIVADWVYVCDFDHVFEDVSLPIKDQGIVKSPVRIGPDCWLGTKVTVTRGTFVGAGCVLKRRDGLDRLGMGGKRGDFCREYAEQVLCGAQCGVCRILRCQGRECTPTGAHIARSQRIDQVVAQHDVAAV